MDVRNDPDDSPLKCVTDKCDGVPSVSFMWPGRERAPACAFCGARAQTIASAMGFTLELTELPAPRVNPWQEPADMKAEIDDALRNAHDYAQRAMRGGRSSAPANALSDAVKLCLDAAMPTLQEAACELNSMQVRLALGPLRNLSARLHEYESLGAGVVEPCQHCGTRVDLHASGCPAGYPAVAYTATTKDVVILRGEVATLRERVEHLESVRDAGMEILTQGQRIDESIDVVDNERAVAFVNPGLIESLVVRIEKLERDVIAGESARNATLDNMTGPVADLVEQNDDFEARIAKLESARDSAARKAAETIKPRLPNDDIAHCPLCDGARDGQRHEAKSCIAHLAERLVALEDLARPDGQGRRVDAGDTPDAVVDRGRRCKSCRHYDDEHCNCGRGCLGGEDEPAAERCKCGGYQ